VPQDPAYGPIGNGGDWPWVYNAFRPSLCCGNPDSCDQACEQAAQARTGHKPFFAQDQQDDE
jgi:hypothetical protein